MSPASLEMRAGESFTHAYEGGKGREQRRFGGQVRVRGEFGSRWLAQWSDADLPKGCFARSFTMSCPSLLGRNASPNIWRLQKKRERITIISGCGYSFGCGTSTSVCSLSTPTSAEGGVEEDEKGGWGGRLPVRRADKPNRAERFLARATAWLGWCVRACVCGGGVARSPSAWRQNFKQKTRYFGFLGGLLGWFHLEGVTAAPSPQTPVPNSSKTLKTKERGMELLVSVRC